MPDEPNGAKPRTADQTLELILATAEEMIHDRGFRAMSLRDLAKAVGVKAASLYYYFPSKQDMLFAIAKRHMDDLLCATRDGLAQVPSADLVGRLRELIRTAVLYHIHHQYAAGVVINEGKNLPHAQLQIVRAQFKEYESTFHELVSEGIEAGAIRSGDSLMVTFVILGAITRLPVWYRSGGRLTPEQIADEYTQYLLGNLLVPDLTQRP